MISTFYWLKLIALFNILPKKNLNIWLKVDWKGVIRVCSYF